MKNRKKNHSIKRTIPSILNAIAEQEDADVIGIYENIMISMYASILLFMASIINFIVRYFVQSENFNTSLNTSFVFLLLAIAFEVTTRLNLKSAAMTFIISGLSAITTIFICVGYYGIIGPAVWTAVFIQILLALVRITKVMMYFIVSALMLSITYILMNYNSYNSYHIDALYYVIQILLFFLLYFAIVGVHRINTKRYQKLRKQYKKVSKNNEDIKYVYKKTVESEERNKYLAYHDQLTRLPNRLFLLEQLNHAILLSRRTKKKLAIIFLDLDNFKIINDTLGHAVGDKLLVETSRRLKKILRASDIVARIGGDEFVIIIENIDDFAVIDKVAEKILEGLQTIFTINNQRVIVTTSIGSAIFPMDGQNAEMLIRNADAAMYESKAKGGNQYVPYIQEMRDELFRRGEG
jgi:diguanylate cyclase (GGDEF)-like protein